MRLFDRLRKHKHVVYDQGYVCVQFVANTLASLILVKVVTTKIAPEAYGIFRYVLAVVSLCSISAINGIGKSLMGYVAKGYHGTVKEATRFSLKTSLLGVIILAIFAFSSYGYEEKIVQAKLFIVAAVVFIPYQVFQRYQDVLSGLKRFRQAFIFRSITLSTQIIVAITILCGLKLGVLGYGAGNLIVQAVCFSVFFWFSLGFLENGQVDQDFKRHSLVLSAYALGSQIIEPGMLMYLNYSLGPVSLAYFAVANRLTGQLSGLTKPFMRPVTIRLATRSKAGHGQAVLRMIPLALLFGVLIYGVLFLGIEYVGSFVIGTEYRKSLFYAKVLGLVVVFAPLFSLLNANVIFEKNNKAYATSIYSEQLLRFGGYVGFIPVFGVMGAICTNVAAYVFKTFLLIYLINRDIRVNHDKLVILEGMNEKNGQIEIF